MIAPVVDGRMRALDMKTGRIIWETRVAPSQQAVHVHHGAARHQRRQGDHRRVRRRVCGARVLRGARRRRPAKIAWKFYTVPGDPSKPFEQPELAEAAKTWSGEWWKLGGGAAVWNGMAYDPDADIVYVGTGQPGPWSDQARGKGDNLFADCILAVRGATGKLVWYYQEVPGDNWDFDSIADLMLADLPINGKMRQSDDACAKGWILLCAGSLTGELLSADPWVTVNWASGVNLKTGRPVINPEAYYGNDAVAVMPGPVGGHVWPPWSYNPNTGLVYIPSLIGAAFDFAADPKFVPSSDRRWVRRARGSTTWGFRSRGRVPANGRRACRYSDNRTIVYSAASRSGLAEDWSGRAGQYSGRLGSNRRRKNAGVVCRRGKLRAARCRPAIWYSRASNTRLMAYRADNGDQLLDITTGLIADGSADDVYDRRQAVHCGGGWSGERADADSVQNRWRPR